MEIQTESEVAMVTALHTPIQKDRTAMAIATLIRVFIEVPPGQTSGSKRSLRTLGRAKAHPLTKRYILRREQS